MWALEGQAGQVCGASGQVCSGRDPLFGLVRVSRFLSIYSVVSVTICVSLLTRTPP